MIAIPNMSKPKSCYNHCLEDLIKNEEIGCPLKTYKESHQYKNGIHPDCPLIEIGDIEYKAFKEFMAIFMSKLDDNILHGEREPMRTKMYKLPNGKTAIFDYDENGIGQVTVEAMDSIMDMLGAEPTGPTVKEEIKEERVEIQPKE